ncbi:glycosyltransferase family 2 protein [Devosia sp.]|uniref:glycosyltransferase family 2 protein n=1 Tax=Devosia sp. TaxID=1871048 RepID=UPI003BAD2619
MPNGPQYRVAVICTVYNEAILLPLWLTYYGSLFGLDNLYLIDDGSTDGSTDNLGGVNVIKIDQAEIDQDLRCRDVSFFHNEIKRLYDAVIYVDIDEFLVPDPLFGVGLRDYIERTALDHFNAVGLNVIQHISDEPDYSPSRGVFEQRRFVQFERGYCKQLIHKAPVFWGIGFHNTTEPVAMAAGLYLFHLRAMDVTISKARINGRNKLAWSEGSLRNDLGWQNRLDEDAYLERFYIFDEARFAAAVPASKFNSQMVSIASLVQTSPKDIGQFRELEHEVLTLPPRFTEALPPARSIDWIAARNRGEDLLPRPALDPVETYRAAVRLAERVQQP